MSSAQYLVARPVYPENSDRGNLDESRKAALDWLRGNAH